MSTRVSAVKRALRTIREAVEPKPRQYGLRSRAFVCPLRGHDRFAVRNDKSVTGLYTMACADCGRVEFFARLPPVL
jgi:hypothetical protein